MAGHRFDLPVDGRAHVHPDIGLQRSRQKGCHDLVSHPAPLKYRATTRPAAASSAAHPTTRWSDGCSGARRRTPRAGPERLSPPPHVADDLHQFTSQGDVVLDLTVQMAQEMKAFRATTSTERSASAIRAAASASGSMSGSVRPCHCSADDDMDRAPAAAQRARVPPQEMTGRRDGIDRERTGRDLLEQAPLMASRRPMSRALRGGDRPRSARLRCRILVQQAELAREMPTCSKPCKHWQNALPPHRRAP